VAERWVPDCECSEGLVAPKQATLRVGHTTHDKSHGGRHQHQNFSRMDWLPAPVVARRTATTLHRLTKEDLIFHWKSMPFTENSWRRSIQGVAIAARLLNDAALRRDQGSKR
jgi:hypothetical protein